MKEDKIQADIFQWTWNNYPETRRCFYHIPNGGKRGKIEAMRFKAMGVISGIPDMALVWNGNTYYFEIKTERGKISDTQKLIHETWKDQGIGVKIIRSLEEFKPIFLTIINSNNERNF